MKTKTAIIGASGYTGSELLRLLAGHPQFAVEAVTAHSQAGKAVTELYPHLSPYKHLVFQKFEDIASTINSCDLVFCGLPHGQAQDLLPKLANKVVVDLGSDFRLTDATQYPTWYGREHKCPEELSKWTYGLPELFVQSVKAATRIANPGCYATASILGVAPLLKAKLIEPLIVTNAISGTSGAGREPSPGMHFSHAAEEARAYKVAAHQHTPEIEMALSRFSGQTVTVSFTPHLAPMTRGIFATSSATLTTKASDSDLLDCLQQAYKGNSFITVQKQTPGTKEVRGSNRVVISAKADTHSGRAIITSVIDNLVKGAAGQAIQNANIIFGLDETAGLPNIGLYP